MSDDPSARTPWKRLCILGIRDETHEQFEAEVARAAHLGATHIDIGKLPEKPRHEKTDPTDPYLEYSFILGCLFRYAIPDEALRPMTPVEYEEKTAGALQRRCAILRKYGLRGRVWLLEPHALPPEIFDAHPDWRGPRVEYPPRARRPYFAPCIDHPEVLDLYRRGVAKLIEKCPDIEVFRITTNDSATGICWSAGLYSGPNGPAACEDRPYADRIRDWLKAWIDGGKDAGVDIRVLLSPRGMSRFQAESARHSQPAGGVVLPTPGGVPNSSAGGGGPTPTLGIWNPLSFLEGLSRSVGTEEVLISCGCELHWRILERFMEKPARTRVERAQLLTDVAAEMVGAGCAERLIDTWQTLRTGLNRIEALPWAGLLFEHGVLSKRWLTRPLVPFPEELTDEETDFWRPFLFEAGGYREVEDLTNIHAVKVVQGISQATFIAKTCASAVGELKQAASVLEELGAEAADGSASDDLPLQAMKLRALAHLFRTVANTVRFQAALDLAMNEETRNIEWPMYWSEYAHPRVYITHLMRDEMDNANELADLLDEAPAPLFHLASVPEDEDCFTLPPNLPEVLRKKAFVIGRHLVDVDLLYPYPNQVEPELK